MRLEELEFGEEIAEQLCSIAMSLRTVVRIVEGWKP